MSEFVRLMHYDPRWPQEFEQTRSSIYHSCQGLVVDVQHVGSTALPGLIARPIIDCVAVILDPAAVDEATMLIEGLNFAQRPLPDWLGEGSLLSRPRHGEPTHQLFLFLSSSGWPRRMIDLRDRFRANPELAVNFEEAKVTCWKESEGDPRSYAEAKRRFFEPGA